MRTARCSLCHIGPEQTDHSANISHGLLKGDAEFEFPTPPTTGLFYTGPSGLTIEIPSPEPPGPIAAVGGLILAEEIEETPQDAVEVEPRDFAVVDNPATPWDDSAVGQPSNFAFGDQGMYNVALRPSIEDPGRGGVDPWGWPLSTAALTLKNIAGPTFDPCDGPADSCVMSNVDPNNLEATFEETGDDLEFPGAAGFTLESINPGLERSPIVPQLPPHMWPWMNGLPAGELHPAIDEMAGMAPNTLTPPNGGPGIEFTEVLFGADLHCGTYDPAAFGAGAPNFGWGPACPNNQSGVAGNLEYPFHGTWPVPNRVLRNGAFKAPPLRNVELTGPYFHTGSYLTLRQVVDFYLRAGDFPVTNADSRDPNLVNVQAQVFGFASSEALATAADANLGFLIGSFADALPDTDFIYGPMPDTDHPLTPEPAYLTLEEVKNALVTFLLALTDPRVKFERAPFDRPEIFVPIDGAAPENTTGRDALIANPTMFQRVPAVGALGSVAPVPAFLNVTNAPPGTAGYNCSGSVGPVSHFCPKVQ